MTRKLTVEDVLDLRAYERVRDDMRAEMLAVKRVRRVSLGTFITVCFENRDTVRYQIQEMARVERLMTDEAIAEELRAYNPLIPEPGQLCATLFIELTSDEAMREWLRRLAGIERHLLIRLADGTEVRAVPEEQHASQLTRSDVTSAVHYFRFEFDAAQIDGFAAGGASLVLDHPEYREDTDLSPATQSALLSDLR